MDYHEAIDYFEEEIDYEKIVLSTVLKGKETVKAKHFKTAISAMQELKELHDQGISMERLNDIDFRKSVVEHINYMDYMSIKDELEEYKQLGDLEEVREAVEKQKGKEPYVEEVYCDVIDYQGNICRKVADVYKCHECDSILEYVNDEQYIQYCPKCGQKILWEE